MPPTPTPLRPLPPAVSPWERLCAFGGTAIWLTSLFQTGRVIWHYKVEQKKKKAKVALCLFGQRPAWRRSPAFVSLKTPFLSNCFSAASLWRLVRVSACGWMCRRIPEVTTSHLYRQPQLLLKLVATGTTICWSAWKLGQRKKKDSDFRQVALVQGNLCRCRSRKFPLPVLSHAMRVKVCPLMSTGENTCNVYLIVPYGCWDRFKPIGDRE